MNHRSWGSRLPAAHLFYMHRAIRPLTIVFVALTFPANGPLGGQDVAKRLSVIGSVVGFDMLPFLSTR